jgi:hypothetical protein
MAEFKVGDRVVATDNHGNAALKGLYGTIKKIDHTYWLPYGVEFDVEFGKVSHPDWKPGHRLDGTAAYNRGWWMPADKLELVKSPKDPFEMLMKDFDEAFKDLDFMFEEAVSESKTISEPPILNRVDTLKCIIASRSYPYASLDATGVLYFYSDLPKGIVVFETASVKT